MCKICDDFINSTYEECLTHTELREAMEKFLLVSGFSPLNGVPTLPE